MYISENAQKCVSRHNKKVVFSEAEHMNVWGSLRKTALFALLNGYKMLIYDKEMEDIPT